MIPIRVVLALLSLIVLTPVASAQDAQDASNAVYFELGGSAIIPSFNYERRLSERWFGRAGASLIEGESEEDTDVTYVFPLTASWVNRPAANHHLELGGGVTIAAGDRQNLFDGITEDETFSTLFVTGIVGYRYQKPAGGFQLRTVLTPVAGGGELLPWFGVSFGYAW
jgi:hypothetical protein